MSFLGARHTGSSDVGPGLRCPQVQSPDLPPKLAQHPNNLPKCSVPVSCSSLSTFSSPVVQNEAPALDSTFSLLHSLTRVDPSSFLLRLPALRHPECFYFPEQTHGACSQRLNTFTQAKLGVRVNFPVLFTPVVPTWSLRCSSAFSPHL